MLTTLDFLDIGTNAVITDTGPNSIIKKRLTDFGLIKGSEIKCVNISPFGDLKAYLIKGTVVVIRNCDAKSISVYTRGRL